MQNFSESFIETIKSIIYIIAIFMNNYPNRFYRNLLSIYSYQIFLKFRLSIRLHGDKGFIKSSRITN